MRVRSLSQSDTDRSEHGAVEAVAMGLVVGGVCSSDILISTQYRQNGVSLDMESARPASAPCDMLRDSSLLRGLQNILGLGT